jgi:hypothetical protein
LPKLQTRDLWVTWSSDMVEPLVQQQTATVAAASMVAWKNGQMVKGQADTRGTLSDRCWVSALHKAAATCCQRFCRGPGLPQPQRHRVSGTPPRRVYYHIILAPISAPGAGPGAGPNSSRPPVLCGRAVRATAAKPPAAPAPTRSSRAHAKMQPFAHAAAPTLSYAFAAASSLSSSCFE